MNAKACAASDTKSYLQGIDLNTAKKRVKKLQQRIAEAYARGRFDKADYLQHVMIRSRCARVLAVDVVSRNRGRKTVGVDDKALDESLYMICNNKQRGYKPLPLRRVYVPKGNGQLRPISIPTVSDRIMQTLYKFALEPIAELTADDGSFGFRPNRCCRDALVRCRD
ncbi:MAG: reverse transcriptase N-terminal domain-containing protein, partial [Eubacterium sp.]|nr:reverse transcriptase N-terminal domain-containing protein [Eubacterium sp.]